MLRVEIVKTIYCLGQVLSFSDSILLMCMYFTDMSSIIVDRLIYIMGA